ncbi:MAG: sulfurtransferase complex subunit TusD [Gammaproteobacteria bacterium]|nr:sulfurtransferase complex subunit TusD [Gammaproteobacteria bacterium]MDE0450320.1 sulfurtransferase complex subunit TusD [Gammaproteobacteria bacterium]
MRITLLIQGAPYSSDAPRSALRFAKAAVGAGHEIHRAFFYNDGVYIANALATPPRDETDVAAQWIDFATSHDVDLTVCVAASLRRGIVDENEAQQYELAGASLRDGFEIVGLGQMVEGMLEGDRTVTFSA